MRAVPRAMVAPPRAMVAQFARAMVAPLARGSAERGSLGWSLSPTLRLTDARAIRAKREAQSRVLGPVELRRLSRAQTTPDPVPPETPCATGGPSISHTEKHAVCPANKT